MNSMERVSDTRQQALQRLWHRATYALLVGAFLLSGSFIIASDVLIPSNSKVALEEGQVAPRDVLATRSLKYESDVLSQAKRDAQIAAVRPVYDPPDPAVASEQTQLARQILDYIENVRYDDFATLEQKAEEFDAIAALNLSDSVSEAILTLDDDPKWRAIDAQVMRLLERVMSGEIREDNIQAKKDSLSDLISATYSETEVQIVTGIVSDLIRANAFYNEGLTRQAEQEAVQDVPIEIRTFARGQLIIRAGEIATAAHIEALDQFGLLRETNNRNERFMGGLVAMSLVAVLMGAYVWKYCSWLSGDVSLLVVLGVMFLAALAAVQLIDAGDLAQPYYFPAAAIAFLVTTLVNPQLAIVMVLSLASLAGFMTGFSLEFTVLIAFGGSLGVLSSGAHRAPKCVFRGGGCG